MPVTKQPKKQELNNDLLERFIDTLQTVEVLVKPAEAMKARSLFAKLEHTVLQFNNIIEELRNIYGITEYQVYNDALELENKKLDDNK